LNQDKVVHIYLFIWLDFILFIDKSATYVYVTYLKYPCDLELISDFS